MKVSKDEYRLPEVVADSPSELAMLCGVPVRKILTCISQAKRRGQNSMYVRVEIEGDKDE